MNPFTYAGATIVAPGILSQTIIGGSEPTTPLQFGTIAMVGPSDGGVPGKVYKFSGITAAQRLLRGGQLLDALTRAALVGGSSGIIGVVIGNKSGSQFVVEGTPTQTTLTTTAVINLAAVGSIYTSITLTSPTGFANGDTVYIHDNAGKWLIGVVSALSGSTCSVTSSYQSGTSGSIAIGAAFDKGPLAVLQSGDQGSWTNGITITIGSGTSQKMALFSYVDAVSGATVYAGGLNTPLDKINTMADLVAAIAKVPLLTPPTSSGQLPIVTGVVVTGGGLTNVVLSNFTGGTGDGSSSPNLTQYEAAIDALAAVPFNIGHLVKLADNVPSTYMQVMGYADTMVHTIQPFGRLGRWVHQVPNGGSPNNSAITNSNLITTAGVAAALALNDYRSSVIAQQGWFIDFGKQNPKLVDIAPFFCGLAALKGATGPNGPATPLTQEVVPGLIGIDYAVLDTTGDLDAAVGGGVTVFSQNLFGGNNSVKCVASVTTAPTDSSGNYWLYSEFSVVRVADAVIQEAVAACKLASPKVLGAGNTVAVMQAALAEVRDVLEDAQENGWIESFQPSSLQIKTSGPTGSDDILTYSMTPVVPLNHIGIGQTILPFQAVVTLAGQVGGPS